MYKIIGGDGNEYGPVNADTMRQWIAEGRVNGETRTRSETGDWQTLAEFPEFAFAVGAQPASRPESPIAAATPAPFSAGGQTSAGYEGDYQLDMGKCITRGWELLKANFGVLFGGFMIYLLIQLVAAALGAIPLIGGLFSLANAVLIAGPLMAGLLFLSLRVIRGETAEAGEVFAGFRQGYAQLLLGNLVKGLLIFLCVIPAGIVFLLIMLPSLLHDQPVTESQIIIVGAVFLLCLIPMIYLQVSWLFALPLIIDRNMDFWTAMKTSWKRVNVHWWQVFGLMILVGLVNLVGMLLCCVGVIFTMPIGLAATMYAYETIFSGKDVSAN